MFDRSVEAMYDHGEALIRSYLADVPDGRYVARCALDDNGLDRELVPFELVVEIDGADMVVDFTGAPPQQAGPINCPYPTTLSAARCALMALAGGAEDAERRSFPSTLDPHHSRDAVPPGASRPRVHLWRDGDPGS